MILNDLKEKLEEIDRNVYYGAVDEAQNEEQWDYIVFNRVRLKPQANRTGYSDYYDVHIIRENFIPEGLDLEVINKVLEIHGFKLAETDGEYTYMWKPSTNNVVEMLTLHFVRARKNV